jgi:2-phospho-L-lactate guanylyltransferase
MARVSRPHHDQVAPTASWGAVVPVKLLTSAKSRLAVLGDDGRRALALAFAEDVVLAALACPAVGVVVVVSDDEAAAAALRSRGARVTPDLPRAGLNTALEHGARVVRSASPGAGVVALSADLPALRSADLAAVLAATTARAVVADAGGTGTTALAAAPGHPLLPAFGELSLGRHVAAGAVVVPAAAGLRRDVDTPDDLQEALRLGVGPRTRAVAAALGLLPSDPALDAVPSRQGTMLP